MLLALIYLLYTYTMANHQYLRNRMIVYHHLMTKCSLEVGRSLRFRHSQTPMLAIIVANIGHRGQYTHANALPTCYMDPIQWFGTLVDSDTPTGRASVYQHPSSEHQEIMRLTPLFDIIMVTSTIEGNINMPVHYLHVIWTQCNGLEHYWMMIHPQFMLLYANTSA